MTTIPPRPDAHALAMDLLGMNKHDAMERLNSHHMGLVAHYAGLASEMAALLQRVATHFEGTDSPLGRDAAALLASIENRK